MENILLVDGSSIGSRAYYIKENPYEFFNMVMRGQEMANADLILFAFDSPVPDAYRCGIYPEYKANRRDEEGREDRHRYITAVRNSLNINGFQVYDHSEGDDILGTAAYQAVRVGYRPYILTGDTDMFALVNDTVRVIWYGSSFSERAIYGPAEVEEKLGVPPHLVYDLTALTGEQSDNIPGVPGIGKKRALQILERVNLLEALDLAKKYDDFPFAKQLRKHRELAEISYELAKVRHDIPIFVHFEACRTGRHPFKEAIGTLSLILEA